jgi:hypothetical protein
MRQRPVIAKPLGERLFNVLLPHVVASYVAIAFALAAGSRLHPAFAVCAPVVLPVELGVNASRLRQATARDAAVWVATCSLYLGTLVGTRWTCVRRERTRERRLATGRCPGCGYDLRASRSRCPECGADVL